MARHDVDLRVDLHVDVAIVGGGLAGSALAAVLVRKGIRLVLLDLHADYPPDFRAEKLLDGQVQALRRLGVDGPVLASATTFDELWIARFGKVVERRPNREHGIDYAVLVNAIRSEVPDGFRRTVRVAGLDFAAGSPRILLGSGETLSARLVVVATGLGRTLMNDLGVRRTSVASQASLAIGFDLHSTTANLPPLTYYGESTGDRSAYLTIFPIASRARANLFVYRGRDEAWSQAFRAEPRERLLEMMPGLGAILGDFTVLGTPVLRPIHLYESEGHLRDGAVLAGDAFATTCPTTGTGIDKVLTDVERLAAFIPGWLATPGMGRDKIERFYADPAKVACDRSARVQTAYARSMAIDTSPLWTARRYRNFYAQRVRYWLRRHSAMGLPSRSAMRAKGSSSLPASSPSSR